MSWYTQVDQHLTKPDDFELLVKVYEKFIGSSKSKSEREMRQACEDYANGSGLQPDDWKTMIVEPKKKVKTKEEISIFENKEEVE